VPLLSGFFSKDEILFRTYVGTSYHHGSMVMWTIAAVTALLTAIYMFRLVFLAFHGESRTANAAAHGVGHAAHGAHDGHAGDGGHGGHDAHGGHGHGGHGAPHEAPPSMAIPLIVLAVGSVVAGYVGVPHAIGGSNRIESFLEPSFEVHETVRSAEQAPGVAEPGVAPTLAHGEEPHAADEVGLERMLMAVSTGVALAGIGLAVYFWLRRPEAAAGVAARFQGVYRLLLNKYYIDEIYNAAIVQPIKQVSTGALWKGVDVGVVDGAVNGVGGAVSGFSSTLRRVQTGSVRTYAASLFLGAVLIIGWYLWS
jgi:NADH-quinone oxidoreductase subunit L